jgi:integrase
MAEASSRRSPVRVDDGLVPIISAHGLRGTHGRLALEAGISSEVGAASLGHESFEVTKAHYAGNDAVAGARIDRVAAALT